MSIKLAMSTAAFGLIVLVTTPAHAQRNVLEGIIGGVIDNAINNNSRRQPQGQQGAGNQTRSYSVLPGESGRATTASPNESGRGYQNNPYSGAMADMFRQQQQQQRLQQQQYQQRLQQQQYQQLQTQGQMSSQGYPTSSQYQRIYNPQTGQYEYRAINQGTSIYQQGSTYPQGTVIREGNVIYGGTSTATPQTSTPSVQNVEQKGIKITLPKTQSEACSFTLISGTSEFARSLSPGQMQPLKGSSAVWYVRFNGNGGLKKYRLRPGNNYVFQRDGQGFWQLYKQPEIVVEEPPVLPQP